MLVSDLKPTQRSLLEVINPQPKQAAFLRACRKFKYVCYGGAAGGGKSYILRWWLLLFCIEAFAHHKIRGIRVGMFCETYIALKDRQISQIAADAKFRQFGELRSEQNVGFAFHIHEQYGGGKILFKNLDDPNKYDSVEFAAIAIDEYTKNPAKTISGQSVFNELRKRLRWPTVLTDPHFPCGGLKKGQGLCKRHELGSEKFQLPMALATNPGGPSHAEVKALWVDGDFTDYPNLAKFKDRFKFIRALSTDNRYNPDEYLDELNSLPEDMRKAYAEGDWNVFSGQFFKEWREAYHVIEPDEELQLFPHGIPKDWKRYTSQDAGWNPDPTICGWFAVSPLGEIIQYRESYGTERLPADWAAKWIDLELGETIAYRMCDPSMANKGNTGQDLLNMYREAGWEMLLANNDRASGWMQMRKYLHWKADENGNLTHKPMFRVLRRACPYTIRTLPSLMYSKTKAGDMAPGEDHAADMVRYGLQSMPEPSKVDLGKLAPAIRNVLLRQQHRVDPK